MRKKDRTAVARRFDSLDFHDDAEKHAIPTLCGEL
jgi:hypothetical protein